MDTYGLKRFITVDTIWDKKGTTPEHKPKKTADIWRRYYWFPRQIKSEKGAQKFPTDDASLPRSG